MVEKTDSPAGRVTVVIPSKNEGDWVRATVEAVLQVSGGLLREVIVVDDGSTDGSCQNDVTAIPRSVPLYVKRTSGRGASLARNVGAAEASGDVVVFLDAHSRPEAGWLNEICDGAGHGPRRRLPDSHPVSPGREATGRRRSGRPVVHIRPPAVRGRPLARQ